MTTPKVITVDFETAAIAARPAYPPQPVGVALDVPGERPRYLAWGHPFRNNCTKEQARAELLKLWKDPRPKLFHNSKFDYDVATTHLNMPALPWHAMHDTLFLIFLQNPERNTLSLKPVAAEVLGLEPVERDAVRAWLIDKGIVKKNDRKWGAHIAQAPGDIVGRYAVGDVVRTRRLFTKYYQEVVEQRGMGQAYDRERQLMPVLLQSERQGVRVDLPALERDVPHYEEGLKAVDAWICKRLRAPVTFNVDSDDELAFYILKRNKADLTKWQRTAKSGQYSTKKDALDVALKDRELASALLYRGPLATCIRTFMTRWRDTARVANGFIYTSWNQVAQDYHESGARKGARTGRLSSVPNFQNIVTNLEEKELLVRALEVMRKNADLRNLLLKYPLPMVRSYVVPYARRWVLNNRDYSQQELRILAHYEDGELMQAYEADPWLDMHEYVQRVVNEIASLNIQRKSIKNLNFGIIYGQGIGKTAATMKVDVGMARRVQLAHARGFPGIPALIRTLKNRAKLGLPIRTWGGREYYCEEPKEINGHTKTFEYKLINTLIQGSAADNTKQAMINYAERKRDGLLLLNVHDELMASCPAAARVPEMRLLRDAMADVKFDVPMLSEGRWSKTRWTEMKELPKGE